MTPERLAEQRKMLPGVAYARLWENLWTSGLGDCLTEDDIAAAFRDDLTPMTGREKDWDFIAGVDLGLTRDCSAVVVLAVGRFGSKFEGRIRLAFHKLWKPIAGRKINLIDVEEFVIEMDRRFNLKVVALDPWQAELLGQKLDFYREQKRRKNLQNHGSRDPKAFVQTIQPTLDTLHKTATLVIESFNDRRLEFFPCEALRRDLLKLRVEERPNNRFRIVSPRDGEGHGDSYSAFSLALFVAHEQAGKRKARVGVLFSDTNPFSEAMRARRLWMKGIHPGNGNQFY
jgi:hypothetical protein